MEPPKSSPVSLKLQIQQLLYYQTVHVLSEQVIIYNQLGWETKLDALIAAAAGQQRD